MGEKIINQDHVYCDPKEILDLLFNEKNEFIQILSFIDEFASLQILFSKYLQDYPNLDCQNKNFQASLAVKIADIEFSLSLIKNHFNIEEFSKKIKKQHFALISNEILNSKNQIMCHNCEYVYEKNTIEIPSDWEECTKYHCPLCKIDIYLKKTPS